MNFMIKEKLIFKIVIFCVGIALLLPTTALQSGQKSGTKQLNKPMTTIVIDMQFIKRHKLKIAGGLLAFVAIMAIEALLINSILDLMDRSERKQSEIYSQNDGEKLREYLKAGGDPNEVVIGVISPLIWVQRGIDPVNFTRILLEYGADPNYGVDPHTVKDHFRITLRKMHASLFHAAASVGIEVEDMLKIFNLYVQYGFQPDEDIIRYLIDFWSVEENSEFLKELLLTSPNIVRNQAFADFYSTHENECSEKIRTIIDGAQEFQHNILNFGNQKNQKELLQQLFQNSPSPVEWLSLLLDDAEKTDHNFDKTKVAQMIDMLHESIKGNSVDEHLNSLKNDFDLNKVRDLFIFLNKLYPEYEKDKQAALWALVPAINGDELVTIISDICTKIGQTNLSEEEFELDEKIVTRCEELINSGADLKRTDRVGQTVFHVLVQEAPVELCKIIFGYCTQNKRSPLQILEALSTPITIQGFDNKNSTPIDIARKTNKKEIVQEIEKIQNNFKLELNKINAQFEEKPSEKPSLQYVDKEHKII